MQKLRPSSACQGKSKELWQRHCLEPLSYNNAQTLSLEQEERPRGRNLTRSWQEIFSFTSNQGQLKILVHGGAHSYPQNHTFLSNSGIFIYM